MQGLRKAEHLYEGRLPEAVLVADLEGDNVFDMPAVHVISETQVEQFISDMAGESGYFNMLGYFKNADPVYLAIAKVWVSDKEKVGSIIGPAFWRWEKACASMALGDA